MSPEHLLILQYGDYGAAFRRLEQGLPETYRDQKASVDLVASLAQSGRFRVTTLAICDRPHDEILAPGLRSIGIAKATAYSARRLLPLLRRLDPDRLILRSPHLATAIWARLRGLPTLPTFADLFTPGPLRQRLKTRALAWALSGPNVTCVANHSRNATASLHLVLGLAPSRTLAWDHPALPADPMPKAPASRPFRVFYAGVIRPEKGVEDILSAARLLPDLGFDLAGQPATGPLSHWQDRAPPNVRFLGPLPHAEIQTRMRQADLILVPSHHSYPEGLPNTIYEALAARTPLAISDHPAFAGRLRPDRDALIFPAADPAALAATIERLRSDPALQSRLSEAAPQALNALRHGALWSQIVTEWVNDPRNRTGWLARLQTSG